MMASVTTALTTVISWIGTVISALTSSTGQLSELMPLLAIGIAISAFLFAMKAIRSVIWGA